MVTANLKDSNFHLRDKHLLEIIRPAFIEEDVGDGTPKQEQEPWTA